MGIFEDMERDIGISQETFIKRETKLLLGEATEEEREKYLVWKVYYDNHPETIVEWERTKIVAGKYLELWRVSPDEAEKFIRQQFKQ